jgi:hypothetical protein
MSCSLAGCLTVHCNALAELDSPTIGGARTKRRPDTLSPAAAGGARFASHRLISTRLHRSGRSRRPGVSSAAGRGVVGDGVVSVHAALCRSWWCLCCRRDRPRQGRGRPGVRAVNDISPHPGEPHVDSVASRSNWLRAGVLGANDGIVSVAGIVTGVEGATRTPQPSGSPTCAARSSARPSLPGRAVGAPARLQSDRVHLRHRPALQPRHQRPRQPRCRPRDSNHFIRRS